MIDFSEVGNIQEHHVNGEHYVQFFPNEYNTVQGMLSILDEELRGIDIQRSILIQTNQSKKKGYPIPCIILHKGEEIK